MQMPDKLDSFKVGFVGLGKLGMPVYEVMKEKYEVVDGWDPANPQPGIDSLHEACVGKDIIFIAVPTPHEKSYDGSVPSYELPTKDFDYSTVIDVLKELNMFLTKKTIVCLISTVLPGTIQFKLKQHCENFRLIYNPYLIGMGTVKEDFLNPEMMIIGFENNDEGSDAMEDIMTFYGPFFNNIEQPKYGPARPRWELVTYEEAEAIKVFYNTFISAKLSLVNMIQDVAIRIPNMDAKKVALALAKSDNRIMSRKYMIPGMGDGGPCHPRDNIALRKLSEDLKLGYDLFGEITKSRDIQAKNMAEFLEEWNLPIVIANRNFKVETDLEDGSPFLLVASFLKEEPMWETILGQPAVYLYGFGTDEQDWAPGSVIIDVAGKFVTKRDDIEVIWYGNSKKYIKGLGQI